MLAPVLGVLTIGAVAVRLERTVDVAPQDALEVSERLAEAIRRRTHDRVLLDDPVWSSCTSTRECVEGVRRVEGNIGVVLVQLVEAVTTVRVIALLFPSDQGAPIEVTADVPSNPATWDEPLRGLAASLFPEVPPPGPEPRAVATSSAAVVPVRSIGPYVLLGAGFVVGAVAVAFGVGSRNARNASQDPLLDDDQFDRYADRAQTFAYAANGLFLTAALATVAGLLWIWLED